MKVLPEDLTEGRSKKLWEQAMIMDSEMENIRVTTANEGGLSPFEMWYGIPPTPGGIQSFATVGYMRTITRKHKLEPCGVWCIVVGLGNSHPRGSSKVCNLATGE